MLFNRRFAAAAMAVTGLGMPYILFRKVIASLTDEAASAQIIPSSCPAVISARYPFLVASGFAAVKVADNLTDPRGIIRDPAGRLLIVQAGVGISQHLVDSNGCITSSHWLISMSSLNHGIYLSPDGTILFASSPTSVYTWSYDSPSGTLGADINTVVTGMVDSGHATRTLIISPEYPELLVVSHGSNGNMDYAAVNSRTARAIVKVFNTSTTPAGGYDFVTQGWNAGYGLRNEVGLAFDGNGMLWGVENSGDSFVRTVNGVSTDIHTNNPAEELNLLGDVSLPNDNWYGYPTCYTVGDPSEITDTQLQVGDQFVLMPNSTFDDNTCIEKSVPPRLVFQAHAAPLDCKFDCEFRYLFVTLHGSWDREPPAGYKLVLVPFEKDSSGAYAPIVSINMRGYINVFYPPDESACSASSCARPVGIVFDAVGRLYMTSDSSGEVFLIGSA
ncbi:soluble quino protein glucose/sorbosone dehydrogenase [Xylariales sp. AK1849]|nr:soluble quino protein glucose/sorbosone dehydrogenase [Xylariales sp. AK1849]